MSASAPARKTPTGSRAAVEDPIRVLVMGDWVVDENWVLARHRPSMSTMEGKAHLRALGNVRSRVTTFCGAGRVARFLYWMNRYRPGAGQGATKADWIPIDQRQGKSFSITGLGAWSLQDEVKFFRMFDPCYGDGINPFTLTRVNPHFVSYQHLDGLTLCNLAPAYEAAAEDTQWHDVGTTRVYRLYSHQAESPGGIVLDRRVDFELRFAPNPASDAPERLYEEDALLHALEPLERTLSPQRSAAHAWKDHTLRYLDGLKHRLRAEAELSPEKVKAFLAYSRAQVESFSSELSQEPGGGEEQTSPYRYVVIKDLGKGTVTTRLIEALHDKKLIDKSTLWYISSKQVHPPYLEKICKESGCGRVRLLFLPPMAIAQMTHEGFLGQRWFAGDQEPTYEALEKLDDYWKEFNHDRPPKPLPVLVAAMPKGLSIVGVEGLDHDHLTGYYQPNSILNEIDEELSGRASMFFAALTAQLIGSDRPGHLSEKERADQANRRCEMIEIALKASHDLLLGNIQALKNFGSVPSNATSGEDVFSYDPSFERYRLASTPGRTSPIDQQVDCFQWSRARQLWRASRQGAGIIEVRENPPRFTLDLWRAMGELDGYIDTVKKRREAVAKMISTLGDYLRDVPSASLSTMLIARPGTGKSFLVSRLSDALGIPFHCFNITQMTSREHVNSCFAAIASAQAQDRERTHLVFFDEINSKVENSHVYDLFLTVLEDGTYLHEEKRFKLDPCIWIFASPQSLKDDAFANKEADFKSRMSLNEVRLDDFGDPTEEQRCIVYQGALQLQLQHTDVKKVSAEVLRSFACLDFKKINSRKIRQLAGRFRNIQFGEVRAFNLPPELKKALEENGAAREDEFIDLLPKDQQLGSTKEKSRALDNLLVEIRRRPEKEDYDDFRRSVTRAS